MKIFCHFLCTLLILSIFSSCSKNDGFSSRKQRKQFEKTQTELTSLLQNAGLSPKSRYAVINRIANNLYATKQYGQMILFLTNWANTHPDDTYNAYWLLLVATAYLEQGEEPVAEYYFERILRGCRDLMTGGKSIHFLCLQHLIQISENPVNRISYFKQLINQFPSNVSITEMYARLALEYEKNGEWDEVLKSYSQFLEQPDASTIQIPGMSDAFQTARQMIDFSNSSKDWTFESLEALETAVKNAISRYDWRSLDRYRSKVNFFAMSWKSSESDPNALEEFSMRNFMRGNRIRYNSELDPSSTPNEAYLRTSGWSQYVNVWYFYFRKVNFPSDPEIHGRWEWAGLYFGEKL